MKLKDKILKILRTIYFNHKYGSINYKKYSRLDILLIYLENFKIKSIVADTHHYTFIFEDDTKIKFWNSNRWESWMSWGHAEFANGKEFKWDNRMPSSEVLYKYKKVVLEYEKDISKKMMENDYDDYSEYLPIKLSRKYKLLKFK